MHVVLGYARDGQLAALQEMLAENPQEGKQTLQSAKDRHGSGILLWAAGGGHLATCKWLVEEVGIDAQHTPRKDGRTALFFAASGGHLELVKLLVEGGADIDHRDEANQTAHVFAARNPTNGEHTAGEKACVDWLAHHAKLGDKLDSATLREALIDERR